MPKVHVLLLAVLIAFTGFVTSAFSLVVEDGTTLLESRCSVCHSSERPKAAKKTPEQWEATVSRMMGKGAKLTEDEKKVLIDYLSSTYKP